MISQVRHGPTGYYFMFDFQNGAHFCEFSPGEDTVEVLAFPEVWSRQFACASNWLAFLKREVDAPDLWAAIGKEKQLVSDAARSDDDNKPFTIEEQKRIREGIEELKTYVLTTQSLIGEQARFVTTRLDYLAQASERLGRKDWISIAVGVVASIAVGIVLPSEAARELLRMAGALFGWVSPGPLLSL